MKRLTVTDPSKCKACFACEVACSSAYYKKYDKELSCIRVTGDALKINISTCTQCGKCMDVCPTGAISQNKKGIYMIDKSTCVGCMACVDICPRNVMCKSYDNIYVTKCTSCGICVKACPEQILEVTEE